ncbi:hypothetical protein ACS0TY_035430 [Phlomoides rotata]
MESPVLTLVVALFFTVNVESQHDVIRPPIEFSLHPPRPRLTLPPSVPLPPPLTPTQPLPPPARASFPPPRPPSRSPSPRLQLPPPSSHAPPPPRKQIHPALPEHGDHNSNKNLSPPLERAKPNMGKKIGLMFLGVAAILQFCILAFLLIRRRQLLRSEYGY